MLTAPKKQKRKSERPPEPATSLSPLSMLRMIWKARLWVILIWAAVSVAGVAVVLHLPTLYRAESLILVDSQKIPEKFVSSTVADETQDRLATISQRVLSATQLRRIIQDFRLYADQKRNLAEEEIVEKMRKDVTVKLERGWAGNRPGAFRIAYKAPTASLSADVTNRLANLFIEENLKSREIQAEGTSEFIDNQLQEAKRKLDELEKSVSQYKVQHNGELPEQESALSGTITRLQTELKSVQDELARARQTKAVLESSLSMAQVNEAGLVRMHMERLTPGPTPTLDSGKAAARRSDVLEQRLADLRLRYQDSHPDVAAARTELAQVRAAEQREAAANAKALAQASAAAAGEAPLQPEVSQLPEVRQARLQVGTLKAQLGALGQEITGRTADQQRILKEIAACQHRIERLPIREQEMAALVRDYEVSKVNYRNLLDKKLAAEMATDMEKRQKAERFTVLDPAVPPEKPFSPKRELMLPLCGVVGLALGIGAALIKEHRKGVFLGEWELPAGAVVLGRVPDMAVMRRRFLGFLPLPGGAARG